MEHAGRSHQSHRVSAPMQAQQMSVAVQDPHYAYMRKSMTAQSRGHPTLGHINTVGTHISRAGASIGMYSQSGRYSQSGQQGRGLQSGGGLYSVGTAMSRMQSVREDARFQYEDASSPKQLARDRSASDDVDDSGSATRYRAHGGSAASSSAHAGKARNKQMILFISGVARIPDGKKVRDVNQNFLPEYDEFSMKGQAFAVPLSSEAFGLRIPVVPTLDDLRYAIYKELVEPSLAAAGHRYCHYKAFGVRGKEIDGRWRSIVFDKFLDHSGMRTKMVMDGATPLDVAFEHGEEVHFRLENGGIRCMGFCSDCHHVSCHECSCDGNTEWNWGNVAYMMTIALFVFLLFNFMFLMGLVHKSLEQVLKVHLDRIRLREALALHTLLFGIGFLVFFIFACYMVNFLYLAPKVRRHRHVQMRLRRRRDLDADSDDDEDEDDEDEEEEDEDEEGDETDEGIEEEDPSGVELEDSKNW